MADLLYLIHPTAYDASSCKDMLRKGIAQELSIAAGKVILVLGDDREYPLDTMQPIEVRRTESIRDAIFGSDLDDADTISFAGGNLLRCIGFAYQKCATIAHNSGKAQLKMRLPFDALCSYSGLVASQFRAGVFKLGAYKSLCAILAKLQDIDNRCGPIMKYDVGIIDETMPWQTNLHLNKELLCSFKPAENISSRTIAPHNSFEYVSRNVPLIVDLFVEADVRPLADEKYGLNLIIRWDRFKQRGFKTL